MATTNKELQNEIVEMLASELVDPRPAPEYWEVQDINDRYNFFMASEAKMVRCNLKCMLPLFPSNLTQLCLNDIIYPQEHSRDQIREILYSFTHWNDLIIEQLCNMVDNGVPLVYVVVEDADVGVDIQVKLVHDIVQPIGAQQFSRVHYDDLTMEEPWG